MNNIYNISLKGEKIGTTKLEKADASMGVVFGQIIFNNIAFGYDFFRNYCLKNEIGFTDYPEDRLISTFDIPDLLISDIDGNPIQGESCSVSGMDSNVFEITIEAIPYPFYEKEFPHHVNS